MKWWKVISVIIVACQIILAAAVVKLASPARSRDPEATERECLFYLLDEDPTITLREAWEECVGA